MATFMKTPNRRENTRQLRFLGLLVRGHGTSARRELLLVLFHHYRFEVFGVKNLSAIETFDVVHAIAAGDDLRTVVLTGGLHKTALY
jgi:hypothetical protein